MRSSSMSNYVPLGECSSKAPKLTRRSFERLLTEPIVNRFCFGHLKGIALLLLLMLFQQSRVQGQIEFEREPINYDTAPVHDVIAQLQQQLDSGEVKMGYDQQYSYLPSLMRILNVPESSQVLVFSKTSFQLRRISPRRPRALYFNDNVYLGWVQNGDVIEVVASDPEQGGIFYTLSLEETDKPHFIRDRGQCISCHASSRTYGVPGPVVRSVFANSAGHPMLGSGTFTTDHRSPFDHRWGGWYVTGTHGSMRHMGNVISKDKNRAEDIDRESGANVCSLSSIVNVKPYITQHSDLVALMVLEHQSQMQNLITLANFDVRSAIHYDGIMNNALERPADHTSESTSRRISSAGEKLLRYMLFAEEFPLTSAVKGTSGFAEEFQALGPKDSQGRSLRDFDLQTRMFKYPCSYLIYSPPFDALPAPVKQYVTRRLHEVLTGEDDSPEFANLSAIDRQAILEILQETKPGLFQN